MPVPVCLMQEKVFIRVPKADCLKKPLEVFPLQMSWQALVSQREAAC